MDDGLTGGASWDADASNVQPILGVFNGAFYIDNTTGKPTFANFVASGTTFATNSNTGNNDGIGFVNDNPFQEYIVRADAAVAATNIGKRANLNNHGSHKNGTSTATLDIQADNDGRMFRIIRSAEVPNQEDLTAAGADVAFYIDNTTGKPTFANFVASGTTFATNSNTGNNDGIGFVNDNPFQEYIVRADAAVAATNIGKRANLNNHGSHKNGTSTATLDIQADNDGRMFRIIRSAEVPNQEDLTAAGADVVVVFNNRATLWGRDA